LIDVADATISWSTSSQPAAFIQAVVKLGLRRGLSRLTGLVGGRIPVNCGQVVVEIDLKKPFERHLFLGLSERDVLGVFKAVLRPGDTVIDVGANVGFHTAYMADLVGAAGKAYAFEPNPNLKTRLLKMRAENPLQNIEFFPVALSDSHTEAPFYISAMHELSSLVQDWSPTTKSQEVSVPTITLDDFLLEQGCDRVRLVKIDVEGHQYAVFKGMSRTLSRGLVDAFVFELTPPEHVTFDESAAEILDTLEESGYALFGLSDKGLLPREIFDKDMRMLEPSYNLVALHKSSEFTCPPK
jgi:FkbM family methyltransferase